MAMPVMDSLGFLEKSRQVKLAAEKYGSIGVLVEEDWSLILFPCPEGVLPEEMKDVSTDPVLKEQNLGIFRTAASVFYIKDCFERLYNARRYKKRLNERRGRD